MPGYVFPECSQCGQEFEPSRPNNTVCQDCKGYKRPGGRNTHPVVHPGSKTRRPR